jgi:ketosteroid isomerase-like protein
LWPQEPVAFDLQVNAANDVAYGTAIGRCAGVNLSGKREELQFRLTMGLQKIDDMWRYP